MEITEVRVKLLNRPNDRFKAICTVAIDNGFVIRGFKVINGPNGLMVTMPDRKLTDHCPQCHGKNSISANFCGQCGHRLAEKREPIDGHGRVRVFADIAYPINIQCQDMIQQKVLEAYEAKVEQSDQPDYAGAVPVEFTD